MAAAGLRGRKCIARHGDSALLDLPACGASDCGDDGRDTNRMRTRHRGYGYVVAVLRSLLPSIERTGIATPAEIDIETLVARMRARQTYCAFDQHSTH